MQIASQFPSTHWSAVAEAGTPVGDARRVALGALITRYSDALRKHIQFKWRTSSDEADELIQSFVAEKILAGGLLAKADCAKGRFRSFLLVSLDRFISNCRRQRRALKR